MGALVANRFELLRPVGAGSYGVVYEARDRYTSSLVALKLLNGGDSLAEERFDLEAQVLAELTHPAIVRYVAHGKSHDGRRYLAMEWLVGRTLEQRLTAPLPAREVVSIARRVVAALSFASLRGVAHRDLKPANLFLVDGEASGTKVLDFGLARRDSDRQRLTHTGVIVGTPLYMSPEQARGEASIDQRTDVFSLGSVLYTCLSNIEAFDAPQMLATLARICRDEPRPLAQVAPRTPPRLAALVHAMMNKEREQRPSLALITSELSSIADALSEQREEHSHGSHDGGTSPTLEIWTGSLSHHGGAGSLRRRSQALDLHIRVALFASAVTPTSQQLDEALPQLAGRLGLQADRLLDGSWLVLPSRSVSAAEQALAVARCALSLRAELGQEARAVVCTGRASVDALQRSGEVFTRGAALLQEVPAGVVHVDAPSAALLAARFELTGDEQTGTSLERERAGGDVPRMLLGQPTKFVGRERELQQLQLIFSECVEELTARPVLITAPAGGGKSRLRHELVERLQPSGPRFTLLVGRGDAMRGGAQLGVLASTILAWADITSSDTLAQRRDKLSTRVATLVPRQRAESVCAFLGEMSGVPFPDEATPRLRAARLDHQLMSDLVQESFLAWLDALAQKAPLLFCLEDLHWFDPASVRFVDAALRTTRNRALMVLALARPEVHELFPKLWAERDLTEIRLPKLSPRACARLLEGVLGAPTREALRAAMIERADGNPFFLEELIRALRASPDGEALPETILAIVQARLDALGEEPKLLVRAASVFGRSFRLAGLRVLLGEHDRERDVEGTLALLCEREIIEVSGPASEQEYVFRHALIRDAAYLLLLDEDRALGHRLAAAWLERTGEAPALLADHYERGQVLDRAAHFWALAADQAFDAGSLEEVLRCGERAMACGVADEELGALSAVLADARSYSQDDAGAAEWAERARSKLPVGEPAWWRATRVGAVASLRLGAAQVEPLVAQIVATYRTDLTQPEQAMAVAYLVGECMRLGRDELASPLLTLLPPELPDSLRGRPEGVLASARAIQCFRAGNLSAALQHAELALTAYQTAGATRDVCETLALCGHFLHELGAYEQSEQRFLEMVALAERVGSARDVSYGQLYLGSIYARVGRSEDAERVLNEAIETNGRLAQPSFQAEAWGHLAGVKLAEGSLDEARAALTQGLALDAVEPAARAYLLAKAASTSLRAGNVGQALTEARAAHTLTLQNSTVEYVAVVEVALAEALLAAGDHHAAQQLLTNALAALQKRASDIHDPALRHSFLDAIPEHARLRDLASSA